MTLIQYFRSLRTGATIDAHIVKTLLGCRYTGTLPDLGSLTNLVSIAAGEVTAIYDFVFVNWAERKIGIGNVAQNQALLSIKFDGCCLAEFTHGGQRYGAHIHCAEGDPDDQKANWNNYMDSGAASSVVIFQPDLSLFDPYKQRSMWYQLWGMIDEDGECWSIVVRQDEQQHEEGNTSFLFETIKPTRSLSAPYHIPAFRRRSSSGCLLI